MSQNSTLFQIAKLLALTLTIVFLLSGYMTLMSKRAEMTDVAPTPPTLTIASTNTAAAATASNTPAATSTDAPTAPSSPTVLPTHTNTATPTASPTASATHTPTISATEILPTFTALPSATATAELTATPTLTPEITSTPTLTPTLEITSTPTLTATSTPSGPPTETPTPTLTPTPVPRTLPATDAPDYTQAESHFWFTRPFTDAYYTWGSWYYPYGTNNNGEYLWHRGSDIQNPQNTPIVAVGDGLVVFASDDLTRAIGPELNFYGQAVVIQHDKWAASDEPEDALSVFTLYGHVEKVLVQEGESVSAGQPIALVGQRGVALGPHLHLEVRLGENSYLSTQNPNLWVRPDEGYGVIAGRVVDVNNFYVPQQLITLHRADNPNKFWRQTRTYPDHRYTFDPQWGETFTFGDVPVGEYLIKTTFDGKTCSVPVTVTNQSLVFALINSMNNEQ
ncbi:MAG TPA: peptidoglycan DD-metalloendopeptidase family protein [Chloroflexi bacterium]|nr:peptidoglycan DD-metalloendopeptidase family protein [Chloroflexota bacterium]